MNNTEVHAVCNQLIAKNMVFMNVYDTYIDYYIDIYPSLMEVFHQQT